MQTITVKVPTTAKESAAERRAEEATILEDARRVLVAANRKAGKPAPIVGASMYVATARGIKVRSRAGLMFSGLPAEVKVVDLEADELAAKRRGGAYLVDVNGAEEILADANGEHAGLVVLSSKPGIEAALAALPELTTDALEAELARRKATPATGGEPRIGSRAKGEK